MCKIDPEFEIISYADAEMAPIDFNKTPAKAMEKALKRANLSIKDIDYFEINEVKRIFVLIEGLFFDSSCKYENIGTRP